MSSLAKLILRRELRSKLQETLLTNDSGGPNLLELGGIPDGIECRLAVHGGIRAVISLDGSPQETKRMIVGFDICQDPAREIHRLAVTQLDRVLGGAGRSLIDLFGRTMRQARFQHGPPNRSDPIARCCASKLKCLIWTSLVQHHE